MPRLVPLLAAAAALGCLTPPAAAQPADNFQAGLRATVVLSDADGARIASPAAGKPFGIDLRLVDASTGLAPKGLSVEAWIRPVEASNQRCLEAARAFRATRRIPNGAVDLNGILLATFNMDGSWGIADPKLNLATANMVAAGSLPGRPDFVVVEPGSQSLLVGSTANGTVDRLTAEGRSAPFLDGLDAPIAALSSGGKTWIAERGKSAVSLRDGSGAVVATGEVPGLKGMTGGGGLPVIAWSDKEIAVFEADSGALAWRTPIAGSVRDLVASPLQANGAGGYVIASLGADGHDLALLFDDEPTTPVKVHLAAEAERLSAAPGGRFVYGWSSAGGVTIVDLATSAAVAGLSIERGISDLDFTENAAFFVTRDQSSVLALDASTIAPGEAPTLRQVRLGPKSERDFTGRDLLVTLSPSQQVLAVHADTYTGFLVEEKSALGDAPPMNAVRLRGGNPAVVRVIDRSFRQVEPGRFSTQAVLPAGGAYELVVTTGIGGLSQCFPVAATGAPAMRAEQASYRMRVDGADRLRAGERAGIAITLIDGTGRAVALKAPVVETPSLEFGWKERHRPTEPDGAEVRLDLTFPVPGHYSIQLRDEAVGHGVLAAQVVEVKQ